jgi:hypothetical protein
MYNSNRIKSNFKEVVGFRASDSANTCLTDLNASLLTSESCLFVNDLSGVSVEIIDSSMGSDQTDINDYLEDVRESAIFEAMNSFIRHQKSKINTKELLSDFSIGVRAGNIRDYVVNRSRFVGYEIIPRESNSVMASLLQLGIHFSEPVTDFPIYFYTSSQFTAVASFLVTTTKTGSLEWVTLANEVSGSSSESCEVDMPDVVAEFISQNYGTGDSYYLGYYESDLILQSATCRAVKTNLPCSSCSGSKTKKSNKYISIKPFEVGTADLYASRELFNVDKVGFSSETYGLNMKMNVKCDLTSVMIQNKLMFASMIQFNMASKILWNAYNSPRLNATQSTKKDDFRLMAEKYEVTFEETLNSLEVDFSEIDKACMGKRNSTFAYVGV